MKIKLFLSVIALLIMSHLYASDVSQLIAVSADGSEETYALSTVQRIVVNATETDASLSVRKKDGTVLGGYHKILLASPITSIGEIEMSMVYVYPNPVSNTLHIHGVDDDTHLEVYNLIGKSVLKGEGVEIDVTSLLEGTYILRVNNQFVKFIKK